MGTIIWPITSITATAAAGTATTAIGIPTAAAGTTPTAATSAWTTPTGSRHPPDHCENESGLGHDAGLAAVAAAFYPVQGAHGGGPKIPLGPKLPPEVNFLKMQKWARFLEDLISLLYTKFEVPGGLHWVAVGPHVHGLHGGDMHHFQGLHGGHDGCKLDNYSNILCINA